MYYLSSYLCGSCFSERRVGDPVVS